MRTVDLIEKSGMAKCSGGAYLLPDLKDYRKIIFSSLTRHFLGQSKQKTKKGCVIYDLAEF